MKNSHECRNCQKVFPTLLDLLCHTKSQHSNENHSVVLAEVKKNFEEQSEIKSEEQSEIKSEEIKLENPLEIKSEDIKLENPLEELDSFENVLEPSILLQGGYKRTPP